MGGSKFAIMTLLCLITIPNLINGETEIDKLYDNNNNPKDDVEFVNPYELGSKKFDTEADDMASIDEEVPSELVITTLQNMPFSGTIVQNGTLVGVGYAFYIFDLLRAKMNFTYKIVLPKQSILGDRNTGVVGQLAKKEVDIAVAFLPILSEFRNFIEYSIELDEVEWTVLMKRPGESATGSGLLAPFDNTVWILIVMSVLAGGPVIFILIFLRVRLCKTGESNKYTLATCMWFVYGGLLKQGSTLSPVTDSARLLFATWWIFITVLTSFYTANLTAFLTLSQFTLPIDSEKDLAYKNLKWFAAHGGAIERIVAQRNSEELMLLRKSVDKGNGQFIDLFDKAPEDILKLVESNKLYIRERPMVRSLLFNDYLNKTRKGVLESDRCTFVIMSGMILRKSQGFGFTTKSKWLKTFNKRLFSLVETGIIKYKNTEHLPGTDVCPLNLGSTERRLRNSDLTLTYKGVAIGFTIAFITFLGEVVYRIFIKRKKLADDSESPPIYDNNITNVGKSFGRSPPPLYQNININDNSRKQFINGRDYYVVTENDGGKRLVPVRTPSAFLFQYAA